MSSDKSVPCPVCHSEKTSFFFEGYDIIYGWPKPARVWKCKECGHMFVEGKLSDEEVTDMYTNYYARSHFDVDSYRPWQEKNRFLFWLDGEEGWAGRHVPPNVRVLDIGCGFCEALGYHKNRGCDAYGVEADENVKKIADAYGLNVRIGLFNPNDFEKDFFDYVTLDFVMEHVDDPLQVLQDIYQVLKPGGHCVIAVPNPKAFGRRFFGKYWPGWHLPFHRHFYSRKSMSILAKEAGFNVETIRSATLSIVLLESWATYFCAGGKGKRGTDALLSLGRFSKEDLKRMDVRLFLFLKKTRILSWFMRLADLFGVGDWMLVILRKE